MSHYSTSKVDSSQPSLPLYHDPGAKIAAKVRHSCKLPDRSFYPDWSKIRLHIEQKEQQIQLNPVKLVNKQDGRQYMLSVSGQ